MACNRPSASKAKQARLVSRIIVCPEQAFDAPRSSQPAAFMNFFGIEPNGTWGAEFLGDCQPQALEMKLAKHKINKLLE